MTSFVYILYFSFIYSCTRLLYNSGVGGGLKLLLLGSEVAREILFYLCFYIFFPNIYSVNVLNTDVISKREGATMIVLEGDLLILRAVRLSSVFYSLGLRN